VNKSLEEFLKILGVIALLAGIYAQLTAGIKNTIDIVKSLKEKKNSEKAKEKQQKKRRLKPRRRLLK
jgi:hypothetical protein